MKNYHTLITVFFVLITSFLVTSCDESEDFIVEKTALESASGDWFVEFLVDGEDIYNLGFIKITTTNSASNNGTELLIDDHANAWQFKIKSPINSEDLTFAGTGLASNVDDYEVNVDITNGSIVKNGTTSTGGNIVDSISFDAEFSDELGVIYQFRGYKRTGLAEDEH